MQGGDALLVVIVQLLGPYMVGSTHQMYRLFRLQLLGAGVQVQLLAFELQCGRCVAGNGPAVDANLSLQLVFGVIGVAAQVLGLGGDGLPLWVETAHAGLLYVELVTVRKVLGLCALEFLLQLAVGSEGAHREVLHKVVRVLADQWRCGWGAGDGGQTYDPVAAQGQTSHQQYGQVGGQAIPTVPAEAGAADHAVAVWSKWA